jgi:hypothetical protein
MGLCVPRLQVGEGMGVLVERCRYLEAAGCASVCINSCKVPTQVRRAVAGRECGVSFAFLGMPARLVSPGVVDAPRRWGCCAALQQPLCRPLVCITAARSFLQRTWDCH